MKDSDEYRALAEQTARSEEIFDGLVLHLFRDEVSLPDGGIAVREVVRHVGAVCVVPLTDDGNVVLERQFRYPVGRVVTEIPAGKLNFPGEDPLSAAKRELREETGYEADRWTVIGLFYPAIAYSDEKITMFLAQGLHRGEQDLDEDEFLSVFEMPLGEAVRKVLDGTIADSKTQTGLMKAYLLRDRS